MAALSGILRVTGPKSSKMKKLASNITTALMLCLLATPSSAYSTTPTTDSLPTLRPRLYYLTEEGARQALKDRRDAADFRYQSVQKDSIIRLQRIEIAMRHQRGAEFEAENRRLKRQIFWQKVATYAAIAITILVTVRLSSP